MTFHGIRLRLFKCKREKVEQNIYGGNESKIKNEKMKGGFQTANINIVES